MQIITQQTNVTNGLQDFDIYMEQLLQDWNAPGVGVGIVAHDKLVFAQGYGDRNYADQLPFTSNNLSEEVKHYFYQADLV